MKTYITTFIALLVFAMPFTILAEEGTKTVQESRQELVVALQDLLTESISTVSDVSSIAKGAAESTVGFAKQEVPVTVKEMVIAEKVRTSSMFSTCGIFIILMVFVGHLLKNKAYAKSPEDEYIIKDNVDREGMVIIGWVVILLTFIPIWVAVYHLRDWTLPFVAPRVFLVEYTIDIISKLK